MSYSPGVTDISGQIRAQSIVGGAQSIGSSVENAFKEYRQNETKRKLAAAAVNGAFQADPAVMQALSSDPEAAKLLQKRQSGKSTVSDEMYLAGMVGAYGKAKEEKQASEFRAMQMQQQQASMGHLAKQNDMLMQQMQQMREQEMRRAADAKALQGAFSPVDMAGQIQGGARFQDLQLGGAGQDGEALKRYVQMGGQNAQHMNELGQRDAVIAKSKQVRPSASIQELPKPGGGTVSVLMQPSGSASEISSGEPAKHNLEKLWAIRDQLGPRVQAGDAVAKQQLAEVNLAIKRATESDAFGSLIAAAMAARMGGGQPQEPTNNPDKKPKLTINPVP